MHENINQLITDLVGLDVKKKQAATESLIAINRPAIPFLLDAVRRNDGDRSYYVCLHVIFQMGAEARADLIPIIRAEEQFARWMFSCFDSSFHEPLPEWIPLVIEKLDSENMFNTQWSLTALAKQYPLYEAGHREKLSIFKPAEPRILRLLEHADPRVRENAAKCIGAIRPPVETALPALHDALEKALNRTPRSIHDYISAIGAYGPQAGAAVETLICLLNLDLNPNEKWTVAAALAEIGAASFPAIPLLEQLRDGAGKRIGKPNGCESKSDAESFRVGMNRYIKRIQKVAAPPPKRALKGDSALLDLIARLRSESSNVADVARQEARQLKDETLIPKLVELFQGKLAPADFDCAVNILGELTKNTKSVQGQELILSLLQKKECEPKRLEELVSAAEAGEVRQASAIIQSFLFRSDLPRGSMLVSNSLRYFAHVPDVAAAEDIGRVLLENRSGLENLYSISALEKIGKISPAQALKPLLQVIKERGKLREQQDCDRWYYSVLAIGEIGDVSVVPDLIEQLENRPEADEIILSALSALADPRVFDIVVKSLRNIVQKGEHVGHNYTAGHLTPVLSCLCYFEKIGKARVPEVMELVQMIKPSAAELSESEQRYLQEHYP